MKTDILIHLGARQIKCLFEMLPSNDLTIINPPKAKLIMMRVEDSFGVLFNLGEILITETEVDYHGNDGYAMVMGDDPERALAVAGVDAILKKGESSDAEKINLFLLDAEKKLKAKQNRENLLAASTKVNFEIM
ncbi:MAG: phosphonate C-P lyase system protein PhnG [Deltaproteobacteria bacterium]|uniref:phosphonate C-P lyase system protein PhnG n=1 Tax=Desulfosarcina sp. BuS5 TaxID=933262 RepID=UPI000483E0F0|nr:phosphonate C-P lyase system protein PhnG [Desulfosarcina sp. BuS5]MCD6272080.1 phosphonate C-P lyase system protein PhnG [Deltaproteobacteria bacterium]WDN89841.1 alpha-D-ribose 1-methylphosphonate 5-triphosphate synthase subunit PhnG [Desulfosarcina sp. BuS5]